MEMPLYTHQPQVFLSSTIRDLAAERAEIERDVRARGWSSWLWEQRNQAGSVDAQIRAGVTGSSYVVVVLGPRYGSIFRAQSLSVTEWELSLARQLQKPIAIYWLQVREQADKTQRSLWAVLQETDDLRIAEVARNGLRQAISDDLDQWVSGHYRHPKFFASELFQSPTSAAQCETGAQTSPVDADEAQRRLKLIRSLRDQELYLDAERELNALWCAMRRFASRRASRDKLYALRDLLDATANISHVRGRREQAKASTLAALQVGWQLPDHSGRRHSASATSGIYSRDQTGVAIAASDYALERTSDPAELAGIYDGRAATRVARGEIAKAVRLLREAVVLQGRVPPAGGIEVAGVASALS
jgi:hypothetical protein